MQSKLGRKHAAPVEFPYMLKVLDPNGGISGCAIETNIIKLLGFFEFEGNGHSTEGAPYIFEGKHSIIFDGREIFFWVNNQEKQGYYYLWFKSRQEAKDLEKYLLDRHKSEQEKLTKARQFPIYRWIFKQGWQFHGHYEMRKTNHLIGYSHVMEQIDKDVENYTKYRSFLASIGEGCRTLNYLLYGPPGVGKTTLIRTVASKFNLPIFIVNPSTIDNVSTSAVLNPEFAGLQPMKGTLKILLFEDFDRYIEDKEKKYGINMSEILNELDGIEGSNCIRFFTANNEDVIFNNPALLNRMSSRFKFGNPTREQFEGKLNILLSCNEEPDESKKERFLSMVQEKKDLSLRSFTNYVIRYLFVEDYLEQMISHIEDLV